MFLRTMGKPGLILAMMTAWLAATPASAQTVVPGTTVKPAENGEVALPDPLTPEAVRELLSRLSDSEVRQILLERLDAEARRQEVDTASEGSLLDFVTGSIVGVYRVVFDAVTGIPALGSGLQRGFATFLDRAGWHGLFTVLATIGFAALVGLAAEFLVNRLTKKWRRKLAAASEPETLGQTLALLARRFLLDMLGLVTFFVVARNIGVSLIGPEARPLAHSIMLYMVAVPRLVAAFSHFLLAPHRPELRLVCIDDANARYLHHSQIGLAILVGASIFIINFMDANGVPWTETRLSFWLNTAIFIWLGTIAWRARDGLVMVARGWDEDVTPVEERIARAFPYLAMTLIALGWLVIEVIVSRGQIQMLQGGRQFITLGLLLLSPVMDTAIRGLVRHLAPPMQGEGQLAIQAWVSTKRSYVRIARVIVFGVVIMTIARIWNIDLHNLASAGIGNFLAAKLVTMLMIFAAGYLVWEVLTLVINRKLANEMTAAGIDPNSEEAGGEGGGAGGSRLSTILPLTRLALQTVVIVMTVLVALGNLGIDITPLLAGAGIVGLAIGFGAQTLVRDIVSGLFFLIDDAFRIGEYLVIDNTVGTVEKISIRSLQLRHHEGPVHTIPYGEIPRVTNNSRDWVIVKMRFTVPFDTDVNKIKKIFKQIGKDVMEQPYAEDIIQTFKSQGVNSVDDVGIVVRGKFMCKPGKQWVIRKDIYARVQRAFAENGIEFARREVRVNIPGLGDSAELDEPAKQAIAAAASEAAGSDTGAKSR
ncbi:MAG: mechanosensitive ion channel [Rhizobiaceae bacterium]